MSRTARRTLIPLLLLLTALTTPAFAADPGVTWQPLDLDRALAKASAEGKMVLVDVWAVWCPTCRQQEEELWSTPAGARLAEDAVAIRLDFDTEDGQTFKRERNILGLPTVLFLRGDGSEIDRIVGFEEREAFLAEARTLLLGRDPLPELLAALEGDPGNPRIMVDVGTRYLQRGRVEEGLVLLHQVRDLHPDTEEAAEATFLEGRYLHRVREEPGAALPVWLRLVRGYRHSPLRPGGISWALKAYAETERIEEGWTWARRLAAKDGRDGWAAYFAASYAVKHDRPRHVALALLSRARSEVVAVTSEETVAELERALLLPTTEGDAAADAASSG